MGSLPAESEPPDCLQGLRHSWSVNLHSFFSPVMNTGEGGMEILITHRIIFQSDWSSGTWLPSLELHWLFLCSLSWRVDLCSQLTLAFRAESLETCHCLLNWFLRRIPLWMRAGNGGHGSSLGSGLCQRTRDSACQFLGTRVNIHLIRKVGVWRTPSFKTKLGIWTNQSLNPSDLVG
jgi:hypothetical protein